MNDSVLPIGMTVLAMSRDRQPGGDSPSRHPRQHSEPSPTHNAPAAARPTPVAGPETAEPDTPEDVIPGTLFAASQIAQRLPLNDHALQTLRVIETVRWEPPESTLRLKDTTA